MAVPLPVGEPSHARRLELIAAETDERKKNARPQITSGIFRFTLAQRAFNHLLPHQRYLNIFVTNVPGPPVPLYLAGAPLLEVFPVLAIAGNMALGVAVMSYDGQLNLTAVADRDRCPDVEVFAEGLRRVLAELAREPAPPGQPAGGDSGQLRSRRPHRLPGYFDSALSAPRTVTGTAGRALRDGPGGSARSGPR